jgi:hypothetical protein
MNKWYQSEVSPCRPQCMSPTSLGYRELGLELVSLEENHFRTPKQFSMEEEKRDDGIGYIFKLFLKESPERRRNEMMDNFSQILRRLSKKTEAPSTNNHFRGAAPFKVIVKFYIYLFEC